MRPTSAVRSRSWQVTGQGQEGADRHRGGGPGAERAWPLPLADASAASLHPFDRSR